MEVEDSFTKSKAQRQNSKNKKTRIDNLEKIQKLKDFIIELNSQPQIIPFLDLNQISRWGVHDFLQINDKTLSLHKIYMKMKTNSYQFVCEFIRDLINIFVAVSDYCLIGDQLQVICEKFIKRIRQFEGQFIEQFRQKEKKKKEDKKYSSASVIIAQLQRQSPPSVHKQQKSEDNQDVQRQGQQNRSMSLLQKLRMVNWIRQNQDNQLSIRHLASCLKNYTESETEIVIKINNDSWQKFLSMKRI